MEVARQSWFQREKNEAIIQREAKGRHHVKLKTDVETGWPAIRLRGLPLAVQFSAPAPVRLVMFSALNGILFLRSRLH